MKETKIESLVCSKMKKEGHILDSVKINKIGWPDRILLMGSGKILFAEFKKDCKKYRETPNQIKIKKMLTNNGYSCIVLEGKSVSKIKKNWNGNERN